MVNGPGTAFVPLSADTAAPKPAGTARRRVADYFAGHVSASIALLMLVLAGLPIAVWLDLRDLSDRALRDQAAAFTAMIDSVRSYYADNVVGRILAHEGETQVIHNYSAVPGAIPIPATLSLELSRIITESNGTHGFRFVSDLPFSNRSPHVLDDFERQALATLRADPSAQIVQLSGSLFDRSLQMVKPVLMGPACVSCHNSHPESPKRDWKVGDVRGIQHFSIRQPIAANIFAFKYLLGYFGLVTVIGLIFIALQRHQSAAIRAINQELGRTNRFLTSVSQKLAKYLSPQHYKSIFSGEKDVTISTERKKLTIFFSDVVGFTSTAERLQPEELTALLNEYLTEMSLIASKFGGTVNKFIGDAILIFFGDPETKGIAEDARACLRMSFEMQERLDELNVKWRAQGIEEPFRIRIGINTGFCNVGNFGSDDRMDYTIIGAEANLAARLQSIAEPGGIVIGYETYVLVGDEVSGTALEPITLKGITHPVIPYSVERSQADGHAETHVFSERTDGLDFFLDTRKVDPKSAERVRQTLEKALAALRPA